MASIKTVRYSLDHVQKDSESTYTVTGWHVYTDAEEQNQVVLISLVFEKVDDAYSRKQFGAAPERR